MFSFFNKKPPILCFKQVRLFGKLPGFADFVRFRSADPEAVKLDGWIQQGFNQSLEHPWSLNICQEIGHSYHLASALSSQDKSGRKYPLVLLAEVENNWLSDYKPSFPLLFKALQDFGISLQNNTIDSQKKLIDSINQFEKMRLELSKRDLLEQRIDALKKLNQNQTWGKWAAQHPNLDVYAWKINQVLALYNQNTFEFPLGSEYSADESSYWLQLLDDIREVKHHAINYYCFNSQTVKKIVIELVSRNFRHFKVYLDRVFHKHVLSLKMLTQVLMGNLICWLGLITGSWWLHERHCRTGLVYRDQNDSCFRTKSW